MRDSDINFLEVQDWLEEYRFATDEKVRKQLRDLIVLRCIPFVKRVARGLARRSTDPVEDLIQIGSLGLIKAIDLYNPKIGKNFKTYATYFITGEIRHYLRDKAAMIKAPREIQELAFRIHQIVSQLTQELGASPTNEQVANRLNMPISKVQEVQDVERRKQTISLDQIVTNADDDVFLGDKIADTSYEALLNNQEDKITLKDAVAHLSEPLQAVINMHYFEDLSQREIAARLNISQMQVSRRIRKAVNELFILITGRKKENSEG